MEGDKRQTAHGPTEDFRRELVALGREAGLLAPHASPEYGGMGLDNVGKAVVFEEAGYSLLGSVAMHIFAPDEANIHLLEVVATPEQKERWLRPLASGDIRSCFCMTEPAPGAGSDPSALNTTAVKDGNHWVINGDKWFITGAHGASFAIIMAKGEDGAATMFLADMDQPGIEIVRTMDSLDQAFAGGHAVVRFNDLRVPAGDILGEPGKGFRYAQVRLAPARLTHCMRWLGAARRAHDIAAGYAGRREVFGAKLVNHEGVGLHAGRQRDRHPHEPAGDLAHRLAARSGRARHHGILDRQGVLLRGDLARGGSLRAGAGRAGRHRRDAGGAHLPRGARVPHLRRSVRGAPLVAGAAHRAAGPELVSEFDLSGRVCVVTGGGRGIGRAIAEGLARHGATLVLSGRTEATLTEAATAIGERAGVHVADVAREADVLALRDAVLARHGRLDVLVNNAGINPIFRGIDRISLADWQSIIDINLTGTFLCCKHLGEAMVAQGRGSIINISSVAGHVGLLRSVPYCASKGGVEMMTRALALDWAKRGVRVNTLAPGWVDTDLTHGLLEHDVHGRRLLDHTPMGRFATAGDMVGAAVFLASDASAYMTGQSLLIDGGWTAD